MSNFTTPPRFTWITLEASEIIELKQVMMDRDYQGTAEFFWRVVVPRVRKAAHRRGIPLDKAEDNDGCLPG
jgi:hypothetical protein